MTPHMARMVPLRRRTRFRCAVLTTLIVSLGANPALAGWTYFGESEGLSSALVWSSALGRDGRLWFGTWRGVTCYDGLTLRRFDVPNS